MGYGETFSKPKHCLNIMGKTQDKIKKYWDSAIQERQRKRKRKMS